LRNLWRSSMFRSSAKKFGLRLAGEIWLETWMILISWMLQQQHQQSMSVQRPFPTFDWDEMQTEVSEACFQSTQRREDSNCRSRTALPIWLWVSHIYSKIELIWRSNTSVQNRLCFVLLTRWISDKLKVRPVNG
jgi:hypothetical protein